MKTKNVLVIAGTRPEIIKLCPLIIELKKQKKYFQTTVLDSGQHKGISAEFWKIFNTKPNIQYFPEFSDINIYISGFLKFVHKVIREKNIDIVVVQGDTSTAFAGALAAYNCKVPVVHVEAGLRTNDISSPWPEEGNRVMIDSISNLMLCPTFKDFLNIKETSNARVTGNTVVDAVKYIQKNKKKSIFNFLPGSKHALVTMHRREIQGKEMDELFEQLSILIKKRKDINWHLIKHHNPNVQKSFNKYIKSSLNCHIYNSLNYIDFINLMQRVDFIISDSGGIQEECTVLEKPLFLLRDCTERPDAVDSGWVRMVKTDCAKSTFKKIECEIHNQECLGRFYALNNQKNVYGKGDASVKSVDAMIKRFCYQGFIDNKRFK